MSAFIGSCLTIYQTCLLCPPSGWIQLNIGAWWGREKCLVQRLGRGICPKSVLDCGSGIKESRGQIRYVWQIVRQLPMKAGWWNVPLALQDLTVSNLHDIVNRRWIFIPEMTKDLPQWYTTRVQNPESSVQFLRPESRNSGMPFKTMSISRVPGGFILKVAGGFF